MRLDHVAILIARANHGVMSAAKFSRADFQNIVLRAFTARKKLPRSRPHATTGQTIMHR
jgi:hypothetical protein